MYAARAERVLRLLDAERRHDPWRRLSGAAGSGQRDLCLHDSTSGAAPVVAALLRRWESRAELQEALESRARTALRHHRRAVVTVAARDARAPFGRVQRRLVVRR